MLYSVSGLPTLQNRVYESPSEASGCATGEIGLAPCSHTGIVTNIRFNPCEVIYDARYHNEQSFSAAFRRHMDTVAGLVRRHVDCSNVIEVGCGKGAFLHLLWSQNISAIGFDPTYEGDDPRIRKAIFEGGLDRPGASLVLRHVLEHIPRPLDFLRQLARANGGRGRIYIEVPCLDWILSNRAWYDIFYEHVNYFRLSDFARLFGQLVHAERTFGGQYLSVVAELESLRDPEPVQVPDWPADFRASLDRLVAEQTFEGAELAWGAASKGVIFALMRMRAGCPLAGAIDLNPAKQGRFMPCTACEILSPHDAIGRFPAGTIAWVMNPNYLGEIRALAGTHFELRTI